MISDVRRADLIDQLAEVALDAASMLDDTSWLDQLTDLCTAARLAFGASAVSLANVEHDHVRYVAAAGSGAEAIVGTELPLARGLAGYVAASGQALAIDEPASDPRIRPRCRRAHGLRPQTLLLVPVVGRTGSTVGVMTVLDRTVSTVDALSSQRRSPGWPRRRSPHSARRQRQPVCSSTPSPTPSPRGRRTSHRRCGERCSVIPTPTTASSPSWPPSTPSAASIRQRAAKSSTWSTPSSPWRDAVAADDRHPSCLVGAFPGRRPRCRRRTFGCPVG